MFPRGYFAKTMFAGAYFAPVEGEIVPVTPDEPHIAGLVMNVGTMLFRV